MTIVIRSNFTSDIFGKPKIKVENELLEFVLVFSKKLFNLPFDIFLNYMIFLSLHLCLEKIAELELMVNNKVLMRFWNKVKR